jgi:hypothetical protein
MRGVAVGVARPGIIEHDQLERPHGVKKIPITDRQFRAMTALERGYAVYMLGRRDDEPNVPDEANPYPAGSRKAKEWTEGQRRAVLDAQDSGE